MKNSTVVTEKSPEFGRCRRGFQKLSIKPNKQQVYCWQRSWPVSFDKNRSHTEHFHSFFCFYTHSKTDMWAVKWTSMFKHKRVWAGPHVELCSVGGFKSVPIMSDLTHIQHILRCGENIPVMDVFISSSVSHLAEHGGRNVAANPATLAVRGRKNQRRLRFLTAIKSSRLVESEKCLLRSFRGFLVHSVCVRYKC